VLVYRKSGRVLEVIALPGEEVSKGEYLMVVDEARGIKLLTQVIDVDYIEVPGLLEELLREGLLREGRVEAYDPLNVSRAIRVLRDTRVLTCVIRGAIVDGRFTCVVHELPSRISSKVLRVPTSEVVKIIGSCDLETELGVDEEGNTISIDASKLDGSLTLITGMKGVGKSHLAKLLVLQLVRHGAPVMVLDLNGEYVGLAEDENIDIYVPGKNLFFSPSYLGREVFLNVMMHVLDLPGVSANVFNELWPVFERRGEVTIRGMIDVVNRAVTNMMIRDAIVSRLMILASARFMSDDACTPLEKLVSRGRGAIIQLKGLSSVEKKVLVEIILSKLVNLLEGGVLPPLFLFAEEAHMYIRDTYWEDIITRMRHYGLYVVFITNQPDSIDNKVFRQMDNIFVFRFLNDHDLEMLSKVSNVDSQTIKSLVRELSLGQCLVIGRVVNDIPILVRVSQLPVKALGASRRVFSHVASSALQS